MPAKPRRRSSLFWRVTSLACALVAVAIATALLLQRWLGDPVLAGAIAVGSQVAHVEPGSVTSAFGTNCL